MSERENIFVKTIGSQVKKEKPAFSIITSNYTAAEFISDRSKAKSRRTRFAVLTQIETLRRYRFIESFPELLLKVFQCRRAGEIEFKLSQTSK